MIDKYLESEIIAARAEAGFKIVEADEILKRGREYQATLSDEKRIEFWHAMQEGYCDACGRRVYVEEGERMCQCWNDE